MNRVLTAGRAGWCRVYEPRPRAALRLVCLPEAGRGANAFHGWAARLPAAVELVAVQYPGRHDRGDEPPIEDLAVLADGIADAVQPLFDRPVAFFGHSLGATVAFEVARRLRPRFPTPLDRLVVSARRPPSAPRTDTADYTRDEDLRRYLTRLGTGVDATVRDPELWRVLVPPLRADLLMHQNYRYTPAAPLTCPLTLVAGDADRGCRIEDMRGWAAHTLGSVDEHVVPGDHHYPRTPPDELFAVLSACAETRGGRR